MRLPANPETSTTRAARLQRLNSKRQTKLRFRLHITPRYTSNLPGPGGGIRHIIPSKARYW